MPYEFPLTPSDAESPPCCFDGTLEKFLGFDTVGARGSELVFCRGNRPNLLRLAKLVARLRLDQSVASSKSPMVHTRSAMPSATPA